MIRNILTLIVLILVPWVGEACVEPVTELPDGPALAVDLEGDLAVFGSGRVLIVADLSDPNLPVELGRVVLTGVVQGIDVVESRAYVAMGEFGLAIVDLTDPSAPVVLGTVAATFGELIDVVADGSFAYTAERAHPTEYSTTTYLDVIDVSEPSQAMIVGSVETEYRSPYKLAVSGDVVFMATYPHLWPAPTGESLRVYDVSVPEQPVELGLPDSSLWGANGIAVVGDELYVLGEGYLSGGLLEVFDLNDPASPIRVGDLESEFFSQTDLAVLEGHAVVTTVDGLTTVDVSNPETLAIVGSLGSPGRGLQVAAGGAIAVVAADAEGLRIVDVADAAEPALIGVLDTPGSSDSISIEGDLAVMAANWWSILDVGDGRLVDVSDPARPVELSTLPVEPERGPVAIDGSRAYVMTGVREEREVGLAIIDITDPSAPFEEGFVSTDLYGHGVDVQWPYAYFAGYGMMKVVDVGSPGEPEVVASIELERSLYSVTVDGDHAFVGRLVDDYPWLQTLQALDIADPLHPVEQGYLDAGPYWTLTFRDGLVYGGADHGLVVADVHDPWVPEFVFSTMMEPAFVSGRYLVGMGEQIAAVSRVRPDYDRDPDALDRVTVFDLGDPRWPLRSAIFDVPFPVKDVGVVGDFVYVAHGDAGVSVYDVGACVVRTSRRTGGRATP